MRSSIFLQGGVALSTTVKKPVSTIDTMEAAKVFESEATAALPSPWALAPIATPMVTGFRNLRAEKSAEE
jgi:hypothetical protein